jgi:hypothetical protein
MSEGSEADTPSEATAQIRALLDRARGGPDVQELQSLPSRMEHLRTTDYEQDIQLKKIYALVLLSGLGIQLVIANAAFFLYGFVGVDWKIDPNVMQVWLAATVVEVVGVVLVVTRYLFPRRNVSQPPF